MNSALYSFLELVLNIACFLFILMLMYICLDWRNVTRQCDKCLRRRFGGCVRKLKASPRCGRMCQWLPDVREAQAQEEPEDEMIDIWSTESSRYLDTPPPYEIAVDMPRPQRLQADTEDDSHKEGTDDATHADITQPVAGTRDIDASDINVADISQARPSGSGQCRGGGQLDGQGHENPAFEADMPDADTLSIDSQLPSYSQAVVLLATPPPPPYIALPPDTVHTPPVSLDMTSPNAVPGTDQPLHDDVTSV